eukprot:8672486-Pyramimonas_sp.AAC.2
MKFRVAKRHVMSIENHRIGLLIQLKVQPFSINGDVDTDLVRLAHGRVGHAELDVVIEATDEGLVRVTNHQGARP